MKWFYDRKIGSRLSIAFGSVLLLLLLTGITGIMGLKNIDPLVKEMYEERLVPTLDLDEICRTWYKVRINALQLILSNDGAQREVIKKKQETMRHLIDSLTVEYSATTMTDEESATLAEYKKSAEQYWAIRNEVVDLAMQERKDEALALANSKAFEAFSRMEHLLNDLITIQSKVGAELYQTSSETIGTASTGMYSSLGVSVLLTVWLSVLITRSVSRPVATLEDAARRVAEGDMNIKVSIETKDEVGSLAGSFNHMVSSVRSAMQEVERKSKEAELAAAEAQQALANIRKLTAEVREATVEVAQYTEEISSSIEQMAAGAEEQAAQTAEVAAAAEEMAQTITETSRSITITAQSSDHASEAARAGADAVGRAKTSMQKIVDVTHLTGEKIDTLNTRVEEVGSITDVINEIADQTNLLALNAAIEAARAGTHGRGFAVVADEVRKLAERTAKATRDIASVLKKIQNETREANRSMEEAAGVVEKELASSDILSESFGRITGETEKVTTLVNQIAVASEEQSSTMSEVSKTIESMRVVADQSAIGVQQIAQVTTRLNGLMESLRDMVEHFADSDNTGDSIRTKVPGVTATAGRISRDAAGRETYFRSLQHRQPHQVP